MMEGNFIAGSANIDELDPEVAGYANQRRTAENAADTSKQLRLYGTNATLVLKRWVSNPSRLLRY
jgi:3-oxoacyl-[acyl-carrier-protein] synthase-1